VEKPRADSSSSSGSVREGLYLIIDQVSLYLYYYTNDMKNGPFRTFYAKYVNEGMQYLIEGFYENDIACGTWITFSLDGTSKAYPNARPACKTNWGLTNFTQEN